MVFVGGFWLRCFYLLDVLRIFSVFFRYVRSVQFFLDRFRLFIPFVPQGYRAIYSTNGGYTHGWYLDGLSSTWDHMYVTWQSFYLGGPKKNIVYESGFKHMVHNINFCHSWYLAFQDVHWNHAKLIGDFDDLEAEKHLWGVGSYDQHQCGQSTFGARRWGLHVGRKRGCLNRIPAWRGSITAGKNGKGDPKRRKMCHFSCTPKKKGGQIITKKIIKNKHTVYLHLQKNELLIVYKNCTFNKTVNFLMFPLYISREFSTVLGGKRWVSWCFPRIPRIWNSPSGPAWPPSRSACGAMLRWIPRPRRSPGWKSSGWALCFFFGKIDWLKT